MGGFGAAPELHVLLWSSVLYFSQVRMLQQGKAQVCSLKFKARRYVVVCCLRIRHDAQNATLRTPFVPLAGCHVREESVGRKKGEKYVIAIATLTVVEFIALCFHSNRTLHHFLLICDVVAGGTNKHGHYSPGFLVGFRGYSIYFCVSVVCQAAFLVLALFHSWVSNLTENVASLRTIMAICCTVNTNQ